MSTQTTVVPGTAETNQPEAERIPFMTAVALIQGGHQHDGLPAPYGIRQNGPDSNILTVNVSTFAAQAAWAGFFGIRLPLDEPSVSLDGQRLYISAHALWHGWSLWLEAKEPLATPATPTPCGMEFAACCGDDAETWSCARPTGHDGAHASAAAVEVFAPDEPGPADVDARVDELVELLTEPTADEIRDGAR